MSAQVGREEAERLVLERLPGARCVSSWPLHHPYAGFVYRVEQTLFGKRLLGRVHTLVDLCNGSPATCDPWPEPLCTPVNEQLVGPAAVVDDNTAEEQAHQCVVRALLHRRLSLRHPRVQLDACLSPFYKPNWLVQLRVVEGGNASIVGILVDGLSGIYHSVSMPSPAPQQAG